MLRRTAMAALVFTTVAGADTRPAFVNRSLEEIAVAAVDGYKPSLPPNPTSAQLSDVKRKQAEAVKFAVGALEKVAGPVEVTIADVESHPKPEPHVGGGVDSLSTIGNDIGMRVYREKLAEHEFGAFRIVAKVGNHVTLRIGTNDPAAMKWRVGDTVRKTISVTKVEATTLPPKPRTVTKVDPVTKQRFFAQEEDWSESLSFVVYAKASD